jgi:hypothetical protein
VADAEPSKVAGEVVGTLIEMARAPTGVALGNSTDGIAEVVCPDCWASEADMEGGAENADPEDDSVGWKVGKKRMAVTVHDDEIGEKVEEIMGPPLVWIEEDCTELEPKTPHEL